MIGLNADMSNETRTPDFYELLGVAPDASRVDVEDMYRRLLALYSPRAEVDPRVAGALERTVEAYDTLIDPERRAAYNRSHGVEAGRPHRIERWMGPRVEDDLAPRAYLLRWEVLWTVLMSWLLIVLFSSLMFDAPFSMTRGYLLRAAGPVVLGGWALTWLARFSGLASRFLNSRMGPPNRYLRPRPRWYGGRELGTAVSFLCAAAYGAFLHLRAPFPLRLIRWRGGHGEFVLWTLIYFGMFCGASALVEGRGIAGRLADARRAWKDIFGGRQC